MAAAATHGTLSASEHSSHLRKAVIASTIGTTIEWYDFFLYGTAAGLIFGKLYFPNEDPLTATLAAFGTYFIGFVGRPIGAAIFGHYGDRIGRKATLIATLLLMGIATFLIAFVPTYASIGIWGAVILTVLRMIQGIGVGGEWGGSVLLAMEWSRHHGERGLVASWPQFGVPCGLFLSNLAVLAFSAWSGDQFVIWGWRIPFAISIILVGVGLWIRLGILETPVFRQLVENQKIEHAPILEVIEKQPKEIILSALLRLSEQAPFYIFTAFIFAYAVGTLHMSRDLILTAVLVASCVSLITIPLSGHISDRIGRRNMYLIGAASVGLFGFLYFGMVDTAIPALVFIAIVLSLIPHDIQYGPQAALIAEAFTPRLRYSGASLGYQLASVIAGGPAPLIATALFAAYHSGYAISVYIAACAIVSLAAAAFMPDYTGRDISMEYVGSAAAERPHYQFRVGRLLYFLWSLCIGVLLTVASLKLEGFTDFLWFIVAVITVVLTIGRLHDIGYTGWWSLVLFVPVVGLLLWVYLFLVERGGVRSLNAVAEASPGVSGRA